LENPARRASNTRITIISAGTNIGGMDPIGKIFYNTSIAESGMKIRQPGSGNQDQATIIRYKIQV